MSFEDIVLGTLKNLANIEENAWEVYKGLYDEIEDKKLKEFFGEMIKSEACHIELVEKALEIIKRE